MDNLNEVIHDLNTLAHKIRVYREDWASLPAGVKTGLKSIAITLIDEQITKLGTVKTTINAL